MDTDDTMNDRNAAEPSSPSQRASVPMADVPTIHSPPAKSVQPSKRETPDADPQKKRRSALESLSLGSPVATELLGTLVEGDHARGGPTRQGPRRDDYDEEESKAADGASSERSAELRARGLDDSSLRGGQPPIGLAGVRAIAASRSGPKDTTAKPPLQLGFLRSFGFESSDVDQLRYALNAGVSLFEASDEDPLLRLRVDTAEIAFRAAEAEVDARRDELAAAQDAQKRFAAELAATATGRASRQGGQRTEFVPELPTAMTGPIDTLLAKHIEKLLNHAYKPKKRGGPGMGRDLQRETATNYRALLDVTADDQTERKRVVEELTRIRNDWQRKRAAYERPAAASNPHDARVTSAVAALTTAEAVLATKKEEYATAMATLDDQALGLSQLVDNPLREATARLESEDGERERLRRSVEAQREAKVPEHIFGAPTRRKAGQKTGDLLVTEPMHDGVPPNGILSTTCPGCRKSVWLLFAQVYEKYEQYEGNWGYACRGCKENYRFPLGCFGGDVSGKYKGAKKAWDLKWQKLPKLADDGEGAEESKGD
jgi:hypothetical protein